MKVMVKSALVLGLSVCAGFAQAASQDISLNNQQDKVSYAIGMSIGENFKNQNIQVNPQAVAKGIADAASDAKPLMTKKEIESTMMQFQKDLIAKHEQTVKALGEKNLKDGQAYLQQNKAKKGVVVLPSGLQYQIITAGKGTSPSKNDSVTVDYEGQLIDGKVFDSSYKRGKPVTFKVSQVIPGWTEVLQKMKPGATWQVTIPANLAYGEHGIGDMIGPNQTLLFKIHLIKVNPANAKQ